MERATPSEKEALALALVALGRITVDSEGRVWRKDRFGNSVRADTGRSRTGGYLRVQFQVENKRYAISAHRLVWMVVAERFIPESLEVNHKDGNKTNNRPTNLEVVPRSFNVAHALHSTGLMKHRKTSGAKLSPAQVLEMRELLRRGDLKKVEIASLYGVTYRTVRNIETRAKWQEETTGPTDMAVPAST